MYKNLTPPPTISRRYWNFLLGAHVYCINGAPLQRVTDTKILDLREHIVKICRKAYRNLGFVLRQARGFTNVNEVRALYEALVKSHLECNSFTWSPQEAKYRLMVGQIQNKFNKLIHFNVSF